MFSIVLSFLLGVFSTEAAREVVDFSGVYVAPVGILRVPDGSGKFYRTMCTAFKTGGSIITTAAHCIKHGIQNAEFCMEYDGECKNKARVTNVITTGGGFAPNEQLNGSDWAHLMIDSVLGASFGKKDPKNPDKIVRWTLNLSNKEVKTGDKLRIISYMKNWKEGKIAGTEECTVQPIPEQAKKYCTPEKNAKGEVVYSCNFFSHNCTIDEEGSDSGAPLINEQGEVVGILTGRGEIASKIFPWGMTVNETEEPFSNVYLHWKFMETYEILGLAAEHYKKNNIQYAATDNLFYSWLTKMFKDWDNMSVSDAFYNIMYWDSIEAQVNLEEMLHSIWLHHRSDNRGKLLNFDEILKYHKEKFKTLVHSGKKKYSQYYQSTKGASEFVYFEPFPIMESNGSNEQNHQVVAQLDAELTRVRAIEKSNQKFRMTADGKEKLAKKLDVEIARLEKEVKEDLANLGRRVPPRANNGVMLVPVQSFGNYYFQTMPVGVVTYPMYATPPPLIRIR